MNFKWQVIVSIKVSAEGSMKRQEPVIKCAFLLNFCALLVQFGAKIQLI